MYNWIRCVLLYVAFQVVWRDVWRNIPWNKIKKNVTLQKCWSVRSQENPDGSDMFLAVSSVQLILI